MREAGFVADVFEGFDDGHHFHAIVGGVLGFAGFGYFLAVVKEDEGPAAWARVADAATICVDFDFSVLHVTMLTQGSRAI